MVFSAESKLLCRMVTTRKKSIKLNSSTIFERYYIKQALSSAEKRGGANEISRM
jgi:hypothetical protein